MEPCHHPKIFDPTSAHHHHHGLEDLPYLHRLHARKRIVWSLILTGTVMIIEAVGGVLSGSLALLSDAGHMLSHFFALATSFLAIHVAVQKVSNRFSFGLYRVEVFAALLNGATLLLVVGYILYQSCERLFHPHPIATVSMFWIALLGLVVN
ncbi:MAG: cation diffusion facilitator family transporter, partial [Candidatus Omnitrophica bacterium]|nr:cation diffusion facilitator family transporter [Candidatus Omnitrophota bacterium]